MIRGIFEFFVGMYRISVSAASRERAADIMFREGVEINSAQMDDGGAYVFCVTCPVGHRLMILFDRENVEYKVGKPRGIPRVLLFLKSRPGIVVGVAVFSVVLWMSGRVVWSFDITGNGDIPKDRIMSVLEELGFTYGTYIPSVDFDRLHADFLTREPDAAWIAVNVKGNHARIELREAHHGPDTERKEGVYANLVASENAEIVMTKVIAGRAEVVPGSIVKRGDLLVSGVIPVGTEGEGARYEYADGEILGYVTRNAEVTIPFETEQKIYTGKTENRKKLKIFKKSMNLFVNGGIEYTSYDKITESKQLLFLGSLKLPVWISNETFREYEYVRTNSGYREAFASAMRELRDTTDELLADAEMITKKLSYELSDDAYTVRCELTCIKDIADISEFTVDHADPSDASPPND